MEETLAQSLVHSLRAAGINFITYLPETRLESNHTAASKR